jgi:hypothetical protein
LTPSGKSSATPQSGAAGPPDLAILGLFDNPVGYRTSLGKMLRILLFLAEVYKTGFISLNKYSLYLTESLKNTGFLSTVFSIKSTSGNLFLKKEILPLPEMDIKPVKRK